MVRAVNFFATMKNAFRFFSAAAMAGILALSAVTLSCNKLKNEPESQGTLSWRFSSGLLTRAAVELPDTDAFILTVTNSGGEVIYDGAYGDSPESLLLNPGSYTVKAVSRKFDKPEFSAPQFGDEQVAVVQAGTDTKVRLNCTQLNSGLRMRLEKDFTAAYPSGTVVVISSDGELDYAASEKRIGYFKPGSVTVALEDGSSARKTLLTRYLEACEILSLGLSCPSTDPPVTGESGSLSISVDTTRVWSEYDYEIGSGQSADPGTTQGTAYSVSQAKEHIGEKAVWVCGYIVGGDLSSGKEGISFTAPFTSMTCIAIASRSSVTTKSSCLSVKLAKGDIRTALNLPDNPTLLGRKVYLRGDLISAYYGIPGVENVTEYVLK